MCIVVGGWLAVLVMPWMASYSMVLTLWVAFGGAMFTIGAIPFPLQRPVV